jgi:restriction system protein
MAQVLEKVAVAMKDQFKEVDFQSLKSDPGHPRWNNTAQWARNTMVEDGLLKKNRPRGVWEITAVGREHLAKAESKK